MKIVTFLSLLPCIILVSCLNTEGTIDIAGKVMDNFSKQGLPNRKVIVDGVMFLDESTIKHVNTGQFYTDSTGCFTYKLIKIKDAYRYHFCFVGDSNYTYYTQELYLNEIETNAKYLSFYLNKLTNLTIKIDRCTKTPYYDTLYVSWKSDGIDGKTIYQPKVVNYGVAPVYDFKWIGGNVKSIIKTKAIADKKVIISFELIRNGRRREIYDTINCQRDVNNYLNIRY